MTQESTVAPLLHAERAFWDQVLTERQRLIGTADGSFCPRMLQLFARGAERISLPTNQQEQPAR